jgi:hypothetical protein
MGTPNFTLFFTRFKKCWSKSWSNLQVNFCRFYSSAANQNKNRINKIDPLTETEDNVVCNQKQGEAAIKE